MTVKKAEEKGKKRFELKGGLRDRRSGSICASESESLVEGPWRNASPDGSAVAEFRTAGEVGQWNCSWREVQCCWLTCGHRSLSAHCYVINLIPQKVRMWGFYILPTNLSCLLSGIPYKYLT